MNGCGCGGCGGGSMPFCGLMTPCCMNNDPNGIVGAAGWKMPPMSCIVPCGTVAIPEFSFQPPPGPCAEVMQQMCGAGGGGMGGFGGFGNGFGGGGGPGIGSSPYPMYPFPYPYPVGNFPKKKKKKKKESPPPRKRPPPSPPADDGGDGGEDDQTDKPEYQYQYEYRYKYLDPEEVKKEKEGK